MKLTVLISLIYLTEAAKAIVRSYCFRLSHYFHSNCFYSLLAKKTATMSIVLFSNTSHASFFAFAYFDMIVSAFNLPCCSMILV